MVLSAASTEVTDEVKGGKDIPKEEQNSSVTEEVGYNSPLSDGKYIICTLKCLVTIQIGDNVSPINSYFKVHFLVNKY